jgi:hypothetical protein
MRRAVLAACLLLAGWLSWRCVALDRQLAAAQERLAEHLRAPETTADTVSASRRVALAVAADEPLFDEALRMTALRRTTLWSALAAWAVAAVLLSWSRATALVRARLVRNRRS